MPVITVSASYGSGGSVVAHKLAERQGARLLDRAIPAQAAEQTGRSPQEAARRDQTSENAVDRFLRGLAATGMLWATAPIPDEVINRGLADDRAYVRAVEKVIRDNAEHGDVVMLGRAGAIVLREHPDAFHVRLDGPAPARAARAMALLSISRSEAERQLAQTDREREGYVQHFYSCDPRDAAHYHLVLEATAYEPDDVVNIILYAHRAWKTSSRAVGGQVAPAAAPEAQLNNPDPLH
jgi:cytidylate kinase